MFEPTKANQKPMMLDKDGNPKAISISSRVRRMSEETQEIFETPFQKSDSESKRENEIRRPIIRIQEVYNIKAGRGFEIMDEDTGGVLYENSKAGVLEKFNLCDEEIEEHF